MVRGKKKILSYAERQTLEDSKREAEDTLKAKKEFGVGTPASNIDEDHIKKEISHLDREIQAGTPSKVSGAAKDKLASRSNELASFIKEGMPSRDEMRNPSKNPGAVGKHMNWNKRTAAAVQEYKQLQRRLNPEAPINVESFRRDK